jgi:hypothetical protein
VYDISSIVSGFGGKFNRVQAEARNCPPKNGDIVPRKNKSKQLFMTPFLAVRTRYRKGVLYSIMTGFGKMSTVLLNPKPWYKGNQGSKLREGVKRSGNEGNKSSG